MTLKDIKKNEEICALIDKGNENLKVLGYTDHSQIHCSLVAQRAGEILEKLGFSQEMATLASIAGFMHDIGNSVNRSNHAEYGGLLAYDILKGLDMPLQDRITIMAAIGNHDESTGGAKDVVSAALIIADKTDVRRSRVQEKIKANFDIHDRVNYAVTNNELKIDKDSKTIMLELELDETICTMYEYFDIFLGRMLMCREAAQMLGMKFKLQANGSKIL
jgi:metal-dependent HD superfamily phosphatase/phosphodiesterase